MRKNNKNLRKILMGPFFAALMLAGIVGAPMKAHALLILDNMIFIGPKSGAATFKVKNASKKPEAYRLNWDQLYMDQNGKKKEIPDGQMVPGVMSAEPYMFMSPRRLMLLPDQLQNVRFMVRRMPNLQPGEYRSYIVFQPEEVPQEYNPETYNPAEASTAGPAAALTMLSGYRVPVFFLQGETTLKVSVMDAGYGQSPQGDTGFYFTFVREGNRSALGSVDVNCISSQEPFRLAGGDIRVYTELNARNYFYRVHDLKGCTRAAIDYMPHKLDPDYTGQPMRLVEIPLN